MVTVIYLMGKSLGIAIGGVFILNCQTHVYPRQWIELYLCDTLCGIVSMLFMWWYDFKTDLALPENEREFKLCKRSMQAYYGVFNFEDATQEDEGILKFTQKYRTMIFD